MSKLRRGLGHFWSGEWEVKSEESEISEYAVTGTYHFSLKHLRACSSEEKA